MYVLLKDAPTAIIYDDAVIAIKFSMTQAKHKVKGYNTVYKVPKMFTNTYWGRSPSLMLRMANIVLSLTFACLVNSGLLLNGNISSLVFLISVFCLDMYVFFT